jgi:hypothetical protein
MRTIISGAVAGLLMLSAAWGDDPPPKKLPPGVPEMVPDSNWKCVNGARGTILRDTVAAPLKGEKGKLAAGTEIVVVRYIPPFRPARIFSSGAEARRALDEALLNPPEPLPAIVRVIEGPNEGKEFEVFDNELGVMIQNPAPWLLLRQGDVMMPFDASLPLATDLASFAMIRRDPQKAAPRLITRGKAFRLKPDTAVVVLDPWVEDYGKPGFEATRVRVLPGNLHANKVGLIYRGNLMSRQPSIGKPAR